MSEEKEDEILQLLDELAKREKDALPHWKKPQWWGALIGIASAVILVCSWILTLVMEREFSDFSEKRGLYKIEKTYNQNRGVIELGREITALKTSIRDNTTGLTKANAKLDLIIEEVSQITKNQ